MQHFIFNNDFMKKFLNKICHENKRILIVEGFNLNLIKYRQIAGSYQFLGVLITNNFIPQITLPMQINQKSATFINNQFFNYHEHQCISSNLITYIFDHFPQFMTVENLLENTIGTEDDQIEHRDYKNFNPNSSLITQKR